jgi:glutaredoxin 3
MPAPAFVALENGGAMKPVEIYVKQGCKYSARARQLLMSKGAAFKEIDITFAEDRKREMVGRAGKESTPQIFIAGEHLGGFDELQDLDRKGELERMLTWTGDPADAQV